MLRRLASSLVVLFLAATVHGAAFTPGNLVIYRMNDGAAALVNTGTAVFLDEYTTAGTLVQSIAVPTTTVGAQRRLVCSGTATSEGFLSRSSDGQYVVFTGYDAALLTGSITTSTSATVPRVIGRVDANGNLDTTTALTDAISGGNPRGATSTNGTDLWIAGSANGMRYATLGATTSTSIAATPANLRVLSVFAGQLYVSASTTTFHLMTVGTGTPTTSGQTLTNLPGFPTTGSQYGFFFADLNAGVAGVDTLYVADDGGNILKYSLVAGNWTANGTIALPSVRGLTGSVSGSNVTLYVTARPSGSTLRTLTDTSGYNATITGTLTTIATAPANTAFQGVAFVPVSASPAPTVSSIVRANANPTAATSVDFTVTFSQSVTGVGTGDFTLTTTGAVAGASVTGVTGSGSGPYTVTVNTGTGSGTIRLDVTDDDSIVNGTAIPLGGPGAGNGNFTTGEVYTVDKTGPAVSSIVRASANPTNAASVNFTVSFGETVLGLDQTDFTLTTTGAVSGASVTGVTGTGPYTVSVNTGTGDGTIRLDFVDNDSVTDTLGNTTASGFTAGEVYTIDKTGPTVTSVVRVNASPTSAPSVDYTVTFSEATTGVDMTDFTLTTTGAVSGASVTGVTGTGPYTVSVNTGTGSGTLRLDVVDNDSIIDTLGNTITAGFTAGEVYTIDKSAPSVLSINRADTNPTNATDVDFTVTFDTAVTGVDAADFALALTGVTGTINTPTGGGTTWNVNVSGVSGNGTLGLNLVDDDTIINGTSVPLGGPGAGNGNFTGQVYTVDQTAPAVQSSVRASATPTNAASVNFTVTFSEAVTGVDMTDFTLTTTGGISGASVTGVTGTGPFTVSVNTGSGNGTIRLDFVDNDSVSDTAGNTTATGFTAGEVYTIDKTAPSVQSIVRASTNPTAGPSVDYTVTFSESVSGVGTGDFTIFTTGAITGTSVTGVIGGPMVYTVSVNTGSNSGTLRLDVTDDDSIADTATNKLGGTGAGNGNFTTGEVYTVNAPTPAPTGLVGVVSPGKVALSWNAVGVATSYNVKRSLTPGGPYSTIFSPGGTSQDDTTVANGTRYYYVVTAIAPGGESGNSAEVHAKPDVPEALGIDISQVYGNGGNAGAVFTNDFIELFNRGNSTVDLNGWSVQYASAAGTSWAPTALTGTLAPGRHYLIGEGAGAGGTTPLPTTDASGATAMSGTAGKVALVSTSAAISGGCPGGVIDFVGYGTTASCFEGAGTTANATGNNSQQRASNGCVDTNNNNTDFANGGANPRNTASAATPCALTAIGSATPTAVSSGASVVLHVELPPATVGGSVTGNLTSIGGSGSQVFFDDGTNGDSTIGDNIFSFQITVSGAAGARSVPVTATNLAAQNAATTIVFSVTPPLETIAAVKVDTTPADTVPDRSGQSVLIRGVVTSVDFRGGTGIEYYIQDPTGGIDIFSTSDFGPFSVGTNVEVSGTVTQFNGLTEITPASITTLPGGTLPAVTPQVVTLSQLLDGVGEPLEGKLVRIDDLTVTSGTFPASGASGNVTISDVTGSGTLRVDSDTDIDGTTAPGGVFSLIGLVGQSDASNPFDCCYQVLPRSTADIIPRTPPTGVGGANPPSVAPGGTSLLTVTVTPGQNPPSTGVSVVVNLSQIGLSPTQVFLDDGVTNGDVANGDGIYSYNATVSGATPLGPKVLPVAISDAQSRNSATQINLNIQSASAPPTPANLAATPGNGQVALTWDASLGASGYNVKRALVTGGPYTTIAPNIVPNNYTDLAVSNGVRYYYVVSALSGANESGDSNEVNAKPAAPPPSGSLARVYFVDIGQGAGTLIVGPPPTNKTLLVDGGPNTQGTNKLIPLLTSLGISTIDNTILTHYHIDHDGGLIELINAGKIVGDAYDNGDAPNVQPPVLSNSTGQFYTSYVNALASHSGTITRHTITGGTVIDLGGGMKATCLHAGGNLLSGGHVYISNTDLNSESISTLVEYGNFDFLISGDMTGGGQTTTAKTPDVETFVAQMARDIDFVQLDHHGSTTANSRRFLAQLKAEGSLASVGASNTFGHPNRETANKYLNIPVTNGNTFGGEGVPPNPGNGPVFYQTDPSPATDNRCTVQGYSGADQAHAGLGTILLKTDGTVSFSMESFDDGGVRLPAATHIYSLDATNAGVTTNFPPTVIPYINPGAPLASDIVTVTALVNDREDAITSVTLTYALNGAAQAPVTMTPTGSEYAATIPAQPNGTRVDYTVTAIAGTDTTTWSNGYFAGTTPIATLRSMTALGEPTYLEYVARIAGLATSSTGDFSSTNNDDYIDDGTGTLNVARTIEPTSPATQPLAAGTTYTVAGLINQLTGRLRLDVTPPFDGVDKPYAVTAGSFNPYIITSTGSGTVTPVVRTIAQINAAPEANEAKLVQIANCTVVSGTIPSAGGQDGFVTINDGTGTIEMKIDGDGDIPGLATPAGTFTLKGIVSQDDFLRPFDTRYTVAPRDRTDLGAAAGGPALITIAQAREDIDGTTGETPDDFIPDRLGQQVKIRGVVTSVDFRGASGTEVYIQDPTAGVDIFSTAINTVFNIGDNLEVTGTVAQFNGLTEITPSSASDITLLAPGTLPAVNMETVTLSQLINGGVGEAYEGKLIRVNNITLASPPATFAANTNYFMNDATSTGVVQMRIDSDTDIDGTAPPAGTFSVIGVLGQFDNAGPFDSGYQLFPRIRATDFLPAVATPASITATAGTPQTTNIETPFAQQLQATVQDGGSAPIEGIGVTFTAPSTGASGTFANGTNTTSATTNASGVATATVFTANAVAGTYNVVATTAALSANFSLTNVDPSATHFDVSAPASVTNGVAFNVTVTARDSSNGTATGYTGTVHFTSSSAGTLPGDYTFTGGDNGVHVFSVTLTTNGAQTVTATDTGNASITGSANITVNAPAATHFSVTAPGSVTNGVPFNVTVTALDASNATVTGYTGTVTFTSSSAGTLPANYTFVGGDNGTHVFSVTLTTNGAQTVTATDTGNASINGTANTTVNGAPAPVTVTLVAPANGSSLGGTSVTISGSGFNSGATVTFGGSAATNVVVVNPGQITAKTPAHAAGAVNVTVTNTDTTNGTLINGFTYFQQNFDANGDSVIDPSDIFYLIAYLFTGGPAPAGASGPTPSGDANGDGVVDPADIFYLVNFLFSGGPAPHATGPGSPTTTSVREPLAGAVSLGKAVSRDGHWFVPVIVTMDPGSSTPQALSLRVHFDGEATDAVMHRGVGLAPIFETSRRTADSVSYLVAFNHAAPLTLDNSRRAVIAEIEVSADAALRMEIDPALTMLVGSNGTHKATVANHALRISGTSIGGTDPSTRHPKSNELN
jgi:beta-lactamase superfamily II metal-dependent hydrolase/DNA/RNA endonuclease YhcR with UshA esterase domain